MGAWRLAIAAALIAAALPAAAALTIRIVGITCDEWRVVSLEGDRATLVCVRPLAETRAYLLALPEPAQFIREAYQALLWRDPDGPGLAYWTGEVASGARTREQVLDALIGSPEYAANHDRG